MPIEDDLSRIADALETIADLFEKHTVTGLGAVADVADEPEEVGEPRTRVTRRRIADRVEWWKATHPDWANAAIPTGNEISAVTGLASADTISKMRQRLLEDQESVRRCEENTGTTP